MPQRMRRLENRPRLKTEAVKERQANTLAIWETMMPARQAVVAWR